MPTRIVIDGKEVTSPLSRALIAGLATVIALAVVGVVVLVIVPLSLGVAGAILIVLAVVLPLVILGKSVLALLLAPFHALSAGRRRKPGGPRKVVPPDEWRRMG